MHYSQLEKSWMESRISHELVSLLTHEVSMIVTPIFNPTLHMTTIPSLHDFIDILVRKSRTRTGTLLVALILLNRLSYRLGYVTTGMASAPQRIFLASLIVSTKLIHDTSPKNKHWLAFANDYFELDEINLMEKQFLTLMDFNLSISSHDFQQVVDRYRQLQKDGRRNKKRWQGTPDCLVTPVRNVALAVGSKNATVTRPLPCSLSSSSISSTQSANLSLSASSSSSCIPAFDPLSNSTSSSTLQSHSPVSPMVPILLHDNTCDNDSNWCYSTRYMSPVFSV
ncbi:uncharacterized protein BX664DRAFT_330170 [Halteromyces radiatus]|uniref:uncharacterized protein n=1 Tax=Halteromyces radiatus TaxID=101107 RepID=UPI00221FC481|nr:uncharacterized protein BX664DRAFT_330170 [Halteromyces radiatus]KAI8093625.1 hypothetical protein BX664DRAFT_330170 [Halteromyces radiatus]